MIHAEEGTGGVTLGQVMQTLHDEVEAARREDVYGIWRASP